MGFMIVTGRQAGHVHVHELLTFQEVDCAVHGNYMLARCVPHHMIVHNSTNRSRQVNKLLDRRRRKEGTNLVSKWDTTYFLGLIIWSVKLHNCLDHTGVIFPYVSGICKALFSTCYNKCSRFTLKRG